MSDDKLTNEYVSSLEDIKANADKAIQIITDLNKEERSESDMDIMAPVVGYAKMAILFVYMANKEFNTGYAIKDKQHVKAACSLINKALHFIDTARSLTIGKPIFPTGVEVLLSDAKDELEMTKVVWEEIL